MIVKLDPASSHHRERGMYATATANDVAYAAVTVVDAQVAVASCFC